MPGADPYAPPGPIERDPGGLRPDERRLAIEHALRGVQLGAWDQAIIAWLLDLDDSTIRTVVSLIERARTAGPGDQPRPPDDGPGSEPSAWC
jgi:hypothetical protein